MILSLESSLVCVFFQGAGMILSLVSSLVVCIISGSWYDTITRIITCIMYYFRELV